MNTPKEGPAFGWGQSTLYYLTLKGTAPVSMPGISDEAAEGVGAMFAHYEGEVARLELERQRRANAAITVTGLKDDLARLRGKTQDLGVRFNALGTGVSGDPKAGVLRSWLAFKEGVDKLKTSDIAKAELSGPELRSLYDGLALWVIETEAYLTKAEAIDWGEVNARAATEPKVAQARRTVVSFLCSSGADRKTDMFLYICASDVLKLAPPVKVAVVARATGVSFDDAKASVSAAVKRWKGKTRGTAQVNISGMYGTAHVDYPWTVLRVSRKVFEEISVWWKSIDGQVRTSDTASYGLHKYREVQPTSDKSNHIDYHLNVD